MARRGPDPRRRRFRRAKVRALYFRLCAMGFTGPEAANLVALAMGLRVGSGWTNKQVLTMLALREEAKRRQAE